MKTIDKNLGKQAMKVTQPFTTDETIMNGLEEKVGSTVHEKGISERGVDYEPLASQLRRIKAEFASEVKGDNHQ